MAQEKTPSTRARKKTADTGEATPKAPARPRTRKKAAEPAGEANGTVPTDAIAFHAYLLWERGEPGSPEEHWFRAERELIAA